MRFRDRQDAGRKLVARLRSYQSENPIVVALPRGGVPVGFEVAQQLSAPFDVIAVRRLRVPGSPLSFGAIAEGGVLCLGESPQPAELPPETVSALAEREALELLHCIRELRGERPLVDVAGRVVILVDDGVGTGCTARAGGRALRDRGAARVVFAAPVIASSAEPRLRREFEEVVSLDTPPEFFAAGYWYSQLLEISDECAAALRRGPGSGAGRGASAGDFAQA